MFQVLAPQARRSQYAADAPLSNNQTDFHIIIAK